MVIRKFRKIYMLKREEREGEKRKEREKDKERRNRREVKSEEE